MSDPFFHETDPDSYHTANLDPARLQKKNLSASQIWIRIPPLSNMRIRILESY